MNSPRGLAIALKTALATTLLIAMAPAAEARTLYVGNHAGGSISALEIAADGSLAPAGATAVQAAVAAPAGLSIAPDGTTLLAAEKKTPGGIAAFTPGPGGALTPKSGPAPPIGNFPHYSTIDPTGRFAYVANNGGSMDNRYISGYALAGGAMPAWLGSFPGGGINQAGIASSPDGRFVYEAHNSGPGNVRGFSIDAGGALVPLPGSPYDVGSSSSGPVVVSPDGRFAFVGDVIDDAIVPVAIAADGTLSQAAAPVSVGPGSAIPDNLALTPDGRFLMSANYGPGSPSVSVFSVGVNGSLALAPGSPLALPAPPTGIAVTPDGGRAYVVVGAASDNVHGYAIGADGTLVALPGSPYPSGASAAGNGSQSLAIAPNQGPVAAIAATASGRRVTFSGAGSADPDGSGVARYEWSFGDGQTATTSGPEIVHDYPRTGSFRATLRVADGEGCSAARIYTGQATLCNGGPAAEAATTVAVADPPPDEAPRVDGVTVVKKLSKGKLTGLTIRFRLSEPATAKVAIQRKAAGRRAGKRCVKPTRANRRKARCDRFLPALTRSVRADKAGPVALSLGKKAVKRLKPGSYRVAITARDATGKTTAKPATKSFRLAKPKPKPKPRRG